MNVCLSRPRFVVCLVMLMLSSGVMFANNATVDCSGATPGAFTTIQAALNSFPKAGPNSISVVPSTCSEHLLIVGFNDLQIFANPGTVTVIGNVPTGRVMNITNSVNVFIDGVNFNAGRGILINNSSDIFLGDGSMQTSGGLGLQTLNSVVDIFNFTIQNSVRSGIAAQGGTLSLDGGNTISNNNRFGISMLNGHLVLSGGDGTAANPDNVISNNGFFGVSAANSSELDAFAGNDITNNGYMGVRVVNTSTLEWSGGGTITGNQGVGIHVAGTSHADIDTVTISGNGASVANSGGLQTVFGAAGGIEIVENSDGVLNGGVVASSNQSTGILVNESSSLSSLGGDTVNNNTGDGFLVQDLAVVHFFGADTATGNTVAPLDCDTSTVLIGDKTGLGGTRCRLKP
jgi:hypothetical protein